MGLLYEYMKEREGYKFYETDEGLIMYKLVPEVNAVYVTDIYVVPDKRNEYIGTYMTDKVVADCKERYGCTLLVGSVCLDDSKCSINRKILETYGMTFSHQEGSMLYFKKEV